MACAAKALETLAAPTQRALGRMGRRRRMPTTRPTTWRRAVEPMDLAVVMKTVQRLAPADTVYTNGAGNYSGWLHRYVRYFGLQHHGRTQLAPTSGAMGYGVPAAVAAALLYPQRTVVNVAGDGDFLMTGQELATATGYGAGEAPASWSASSSTTAATARSACTRSASTRAASAAATCSTRTSSALARAYGWQAHRVDTTAHFEPAFAAAMAADGPTLIHIKLDTDVITSRTTLGAIRETAQRAGS